MPVSIDTADLFRHVSADKAAFYRCIMDVFAAARRQYRLQLRPDEVLTEAVWPDTPPRLEEVSTALTQLATWGNLESQPDMARVSSLNDYYRARFLYRLSQGGEAVESALAVFARTLSRRAERRHAVRARDCGASARNPSDPGWRGRILFYSTQFADDLLQKPSCVAGRRLAVENNQRLKVAEPD